MAVPPTVHGQRRLGTAVERAPHARRHSLSADRRRPRPTCACRLRFTLLEILIVVAVVAVVMGLVLPRVGHLPARLQAERCVSAVQAALDETGLRARATGRPYRLVLKVDEGSSRFSVSPEVSDPLALPLSGAAAQVGSGGAPTADVPREGSMVPGASEYVLPDALQWTPESLQAGTAAGDDGPTLVFYSSGEAGGPELEFVVGRRHYLLEVDRLTGRADIRLSKGP